MTSVTYPTHPRAFFLEHIDLLSMIGWKQQKTARRLENNIWEYRWDERRGRSKQRGWQKPHPTTKKKNSQWYTLLHPWYVSIQIKCKLLGWICTLLHPCIHLLILPKIESSSWMLMVCMYVFKLNGAWDEKSTIQIVKKDQKEKATPYYGRDKCR